MHCEMRSWKKRKDGRDESVTYNLWHKSGLMKRRRNAMNVRSDLTWMKERSKSQTQ
jgi:hypothetical protein